MKWPWQRDRESVDRARAGAEAAERELTRVRAQAPRVHRVSQKIVAELEVNHFAETLLASMQRKGTT